ncbi:MAG: DUF2304 domain-containing protein [Verrucomicrobia bacterium]|nr:DUF2304 domain-containing protein [Verrucomicrobiota bacterium]MCH8514416.1 DUF2304 domain-containing protein [Kiritimatiellia bacterium]
MNPWLSYGLPGAVMLLVGLVLFGQARSVRLLAAFFTVIGFLLILVAIFPGLQRAVLPNQIRLFMGLISVTHLFITMEAVRRNRLKERYALLWIGTGLVLFAFAVQPNVIAWLVQVTGMHYTSAIMLVVFSFLLLIAFHISLVLSQYENERRKFSQKIALLEARIEGLEKSERERNPEEDQGTTAKR